jgi:hypothetical protein
MISVSTVRKTQWAAHRSIDHACRFWTSRRDAARHSGKATHFNSLGLRFMHPAAQPSVLGLLGGLLPRARALRFMNFTTSAGVLRNMGQRHRGSLKATAHWDSFPSNKHRIIARHQCALREARREARAGYITPAQRRRQMHLGQSRSSTVSLGYDNGSVRTQISADSFKRGRSGAWRTPCIGRAWSSALPIEPTAAHSAHRIGRAKARQVAAHALSAESVRRVYSGVCGESAACDELEAACTRWSVDKF